MAILLPVSILLIMPVIMLGIRLARQRFLYYWLIAAGTALAAWTMVLLERPPTNRLLVLWEPAALFPASPRLLVDGYSWPFAAALAALALAVMLAEVARAAQADWLSWSSSLALVSVGIVAAEAGNPLTLVLAWAGLDLFDLAVFVAHPAENERREQAILAFSVRSLGILLLLWAMMSARAGGKDLDFEQITPEISELLLMAAGLRLGALSLHRNFRDAAPQRRGLGTILRMAPAASSLMLFSRTATAGVPPAMLPWLLGLAAVLALWASTAWALARDELAGRSAWILALGALTLAAAVRGQPAAALAWGQAMLFSGGLLFLMSARHRLLLIIGCLGLLGVSSLPLTTAWTGVEIYSPPFLPILALFILAQALLLLGYARHMLRIGEPPGSAERWVWLIYPAGLALLPLTQYVMLWRGRQAGFPSMTGSWPAAIVFLLAILGFVLSRTGPRLPVQPSLRPRRLLPEGWLYSLVWSLYRACGRGVAFINGVLEGEGGLLWTLLILTLLLSWLFQANVTR